jgi:indolepyruvate decarboxylase
VDAPAFASPGDAFEVEPLSRLRRWEFSKLADVFTGCDGYRVGTVGELERALAEIDARPGRLAIVDVRLPEWSLPSNALWRASLGPRPT